MIEYVSTRDHKKSVSAAQAITRGLAPDGGLYVPVSIPKGPDPASLVGMSYQQMASRIISLYFDQFDPEDIAACVDAAYGRSFDDASITPLRAFSGGYMLELWHGPTCAFKDLALTVLPRLMTLSRRHLGQSDTTAILTATSGDTGKAALSGFADVPGTDLTVFYPRVGVSPVQKLQIQTAEGANVEVVAVDGNFDDCQRMVKQAYASREVLDACDGVSLSSANSINIGRLVPQIVYYYASYARLIERGAIRCGDAVSFCVPTGNFGDILSGYLAKRMGLPVSRLICASNSNAVLTDFIRTGTYDANRPFHTTISPSMDILISSNLERLIDLIGQDDQATGGLMESLRATGRYTVPDHYIGAIRALFGACSADDAACRAEIGRMWREEGLLVDPHTAVALCAARADREKAPSDDPCVVLSTASPYKFSASVLRCLTEAVPDDEFDCMDKLSSLTHTAIPEPLASLRRKPIRFTKCIGRDEGIRFIAEKMRALSAR